MVSESIISKNEKSIEGIDLEKLRTVFFRNLHWVVIILIITNVVAYLTIRWTKPLFETSSQLRLDVKQDANIIGLTTMENNQSNLIAGEIELILSKLFLSRVIEDMDLDISYYSVGEFLIDEKFQNSAINVEVLDAPNQVMDERFYVYIVNENQYRIQWGEEPTDSSPQYQFGKTVTYQGLKFKLYLTKYFESRVNDRMHFFILNSQQSLLTYLHKNLNVEYDNVSANTIRISFTDHNPFKAQSMVNAIDTLYLTFTKQKKNQENEQKIEWLNGELEKIENELEGFENYFEDFTIQNKTNNLNEDLKNTILMMNELDSQKYVLNTKLDKINNFIKKLHDGVKANLLELDETLYPPNVGETFKDLQEAYMEMDRIKLSYNETTFAYQQKMELINSLSESLRGQLNIIKERIASDLERLTEQRKELERNFSSLPGKSTEYNKKMRYFNLYEEFLLTLMQSKAEFEIAKAGTNTDFVILSAPNLPLEPISPNNLLIQGLGVVSGLFFSFILIGILYVSHNRITSVREIEKLTTTPILGSVPKSRNRIQQTQLIIDKRPKSAISESLRSIRTNIDFFVNTEKHQILSVTSTIGGEGKTFVSVNLGGIFAVSKRRVVLLDLDMRKPRVHLAFGDPSAEKGVSTILIQKYSVEDCIRKTSLPFLDYVPAGPTPPNPSELLMSAQFDQMLQQLKNKYDLVILDTPPVGLVTDGMLAMKKADLALYIFRANYSKNDFVETLKKLTRDNKFQKIAIVMNALPLTKSNSYGYGYYDEQPEDPTQNRA